MSKIKKYNHVAANHATRRYWIKIFHNLLDMSLLNKYNIYMRNTDRPMPRYDFMVEIIEALCYGASTFNPFNILLLDPQENQSPQSFSMLFGN